MECLLNQYQQQGYKTAIMNLISCEGEYGVITIE